MKQRAAERQKRWAFEIMLRIHPQSCEDFLHWCGLLGVLGLNVPETREAVPDDAPWLDAPYQDLPMDYLYDLLAWEGIGEENLIVGLPWIDTVQRFSTHGSDELVAFPVKDFLRHLRALEPAAFERAAAAESLAKYNRDIAPSMDRDTDEEELALVVAEVAEYCVVNDFVLAIRY